MATQILQLEFGDVTNFVNNVPVTNPLSTTTIAVVAPGSPTTNWTDSASYLCSLGWTLIQVHAVRDDIFYYFSK